MTNYTETFTFQLRDIASHGGSFTIPLVDLHSDESWPKRFTTLSEELAVNTPVFGGKCPQAAPTDAHGELADELVRPIRIRYRVPLAPNFGALPGPMGGDYQRSLKTLLRRQLERLYDVYLMLGAEAANAAEESVGLWPGLLTVTPGSEQPPIPASMLDEKLQDLVDGDGVDHHYEGMSVLMSPEARRSLARRRDRASRDRSQLEVIEETFGLVTVSSLLARRDGGGNTASDSRDGGSPGPETILVRRGYHPAAEAGLLDKVQLSTERRRDAQELKIALTAASPVILRPDPYIQIPVAMRTD